MCYHDTGDALSRRQASICGTVKMRDVTTRIILILTTLFYTSGVAHLLHDHISHDITRVSWHDQHGCVHEDTPVSRLVAHLDDEVAKQDQPQGGSQPDGHSPSPHREDCGVCHALTSLHLCDLAQPPLAFVLDFVSSKWLLVERLEVWKHPGRTWTPRGPPSDVFI